MPEHSGREVGVETQWKQADVLPIIARIIEKAYREHHASLPRKRSPGGRRKIPKVATWSRRHASNSRISSRRNGWPTIWYRGSATHHCWRIRLGAGFEHNKIDGLWAYKPLASADP